MGSKEVLGFTDNIAFFRYGFPCGGYSVDMSLPSWRPACSLGWKGVWIGTPLGNSLERKFRGR